MKLEIKELYLKDFAGVSEKEIDFNGNTKIYGDNATGKTTIAVALNWLLFDKGLEDQKIDIVPKNEKNEHIHEKMPTVKAIISVDGKEKVFSKESHPKYEKVDGTNTKSYKNSRTTKQYIDEVPYPITKFKAAISEIIDEELFKLLTNPDAFATLHWEEKRKILFQISGEVSDEDIIDSSEKLADLKEVLSDRTIEEHRKVIAERIKRTKKDLEEIPIKINTLEDQKENKDIDIVKHQEDVEEYEKLISNLNQEKADIENGGVVPTLRNQIKEIEFKKKELERSLDSDSQSLDREAEQEIRTLEQELSFLKRRESFNGDTINTFSKKRERLLSDYHELRKQKESVEAQVYEAHEHDDNCHACGQKLPKDQQELAKENFNLSKSVKLEALHKQMEEKVESGKEVNKELLSLKEKESEYIVSKREIETKLERAKNALENQKEPDNSEVFGKIEELNIEIEKISDHISNAKEISEEKVVKINVEISEHKVKLRALNEDLSIIYANQRIDTTIDKLRNEESEHLAYLETLQHQRWMLEEFTKQKVALITEQVNKKFEIAQFKLFHQQVNGDIKETCEIMVNGVTYDGGLNNAMKINVGLDIIETLCTYYDIQAPIFIDNAESVTDMYKTTSQQVQLIVNENDKELRVEAA